MDQELYVDWFLHHFLEHAVKSRPLMLWLITLHIEAFKMAAEHQIVIFWLPPHTTTNSQTLDTTCFKPLNSYWVDDCCKYLFAHPSQVINKFQFSALFVDAWSQGMTISNITFGFRTTQVCPFNPKAILDKLCTSFEKGLRVSLQKPSHFLQR